MKKTVVEPHKSSLGMDANLTSLVIFIGMAIVSWIPYLGWLAWGVPLVFFFMEKNSKFVKFQAVTALVLGAIGAAISVVLQIFIWVLTPRSLSGLYNYVNGGWGVWALLGAVSTIISVILTAITLYLIVMAFGYKQVELPFIGPIAAKAAAKLETVKPPQAGGGSAEAKSDSGDQNNGMEG